MTTYIRARSWHLVKVVTDSGWITRCGLSLNEDADVSYEIKLTEKTCESCLRYAKRDEERRMVSGEPETDEANP